MDKFSATTGKNLLTPGKGKKNVLGRKFRVPESRSYNRHQPVFEILAVEYANETFSNVSVRTDTGNEIILNVWHNFRYEVPTNQR